MTAIDERFEEFMKTLPSVELIDELDIGSLSASKKADYLGFDRRVIIEQKCVTQDQSQKIQDYIDQFQDEDWYPLFYGERDINNILKFAPDGEVIINNTISKSTRLIRDYFKKSNLQISSSKTIFKIPDAFGILVILNDSVKVLSPKVLVHSIQSLLKQKNDDALKRFSNINLVLLISETHLYKSKAPSILIINGPGEVPVEINEYLDYLIFSWGQFNGGGVEQIDSENFLWDEFIQQKTPPKDSLRRHEVRLLWYKQNPYMRAWTDDEVMVYGAKVVKETTPSLIKGGEKQPQEVLNELILKFGDFIEEMNHRGLDMKTLDGYVDHESMSNHVNSKEGE